MEEGVGVLKSGVMEKKPGFDKNRESMQVSA